MPKILIGNIIGPQGPQGKQGIQGTQGPQGVPGPLPPLTNTALATVAGVSALDAVMGKTLQDQITKANSDLAAVETDLSNVRAQIDPLKANYVNDINRNIVNKVNIVLWDSKTTDTPFKTGNTIRGNGFCITYSSGEPFLCQLAMAVGDSHLFTRHMNEGGWSGWTTIGTPSV